MALCVNINKFSLVWESNRSQIVKGLNRLLPKEIRSRQWWISEESQQTDFKTTYVPSQGFPGYGLSTRPEISSTCPPLNCHTTVFLYLLWIRVFRYPKLLNRSFDNGYRWLYCILANNDNTSSSCHTERTKNKREERRLAKMAVLDCTWKEHAISTTS